MNSVWTSGRCLRGHDITDPANVQHKRSGRRECRRCEAGRRGKAQPPVVDPQDWSIPTSDVRLGEWVA